MSAAALLVMLGVAPYVGFTGPADAAVSTAARGSYAGQLSIGHGRKLYLRCAGRGSPTVIMESGIHDSSDTWTLTDTRPPVPPSPSVFSGVARFTHVCVYDRPGTIRYTNPIALTTRSTPVKMPRTLPSMVNDLHTLLKRARVPSPYLLVAHSFGGLIIRLFAQRFRPQTCGLVFVDAFGVNIRRLFGGRLWPRYVHLLNHPGTPLDTQPGFETIDVDSAINAIQMAKLLPRVPLAVISKTEPFATAPTVPKNLTARLEQVWPNVQQALVKLEPRTPHILATGSDHYVQIHDPDLTTSIIRLIFQRAKAAEIRAGVDAGTTQANRHAAVRSNTLPRGGHSSARPPPPRAETGIDERSNMQPSRVPQRLVGFASVGLLLSGVVAALAAASPVLGSTAVSARQRAALQFTPWAATVVAPPSSVLGSDGRRHLVYEMTVANSAAPTTLLSVQVRDGRSGGVIGRISAAKSPDFMSSQASAAPTRSLAPSEGGLLWFDVALPRDARIPRTLTHTITIRVAPSGEKPFIRRMAGMGQTTLDLRPPIRVRAPLEPGTYVDGNGCCTKSAHTRALLTIDGRRYLSQRYAIDWVIAGRDGHTYMGDPTKNTSYFVFGKLAVAAASGIVADTNDGLPENNPPNPPKNLERLTTRTALGNFAAINAGGGHFLFYCHLQPGSLRVRKGQKVRAGDPIGLVGNTGSSTEPHLHFMVTDSPQPLASNGRPWVLSSWRFAGQVANLAEFSNNNQPARIIPAPRPALRHNQLPLQGALVRLTRHGRVTG